MDLAILNGHVYVEGQFINTNLYIKNEKIQAITTDYLEASTQIDAAGLYVMPGFIDPHVHFNLEVAGKYNRDDFERGSMLSAFGGVTTYIDFLAPVDNLDDAKKALISRRIEAEKSHVDYSFHMTICDYKEDIDDLMTWCNEEGIPSIKLFTTYRSTHRQTPDSTILKLLEKSKQYNVRIHMHVENDNMIDESKGRKVNQHEVSRPAISEISEVLKLASMVEFTKGFAYIVHTNCGTTVEQLTTRYKDLLTKGQIIIESCPHYLLLNSDKYNKSLGYRFVMTPPLREEVERAKLCQFFEHIDVLGTDHCPYEEVEKNKKLLDDLPNGIEGIPYTFASLYPVFGESIIDKMTIYPAKIHGLFPQKGVIKEGSDADLVIVDLDKKWSLHNQLPWFRYFKEKEIVSPFAEIPMQGFVKTTILRGEPVMDEGTILPTKGNFVARRLMI